MVELPEHEDIVITGFLEESMKHAAIKGSLALVQSSYFESFSIVLCEAWVQKRPALVQGASTVLRGQAMRSNGAIPYEGYAEFEQAVMMLFEDRDLADQMGVCGRSYVEQQYEWSNVIKNVESALEIAKVEFEKRPITLSRG
jgi:glycosyltransferase involved in cell wall biosynthesis